MRKEDIKDVVELLLLRLSKEQLPSTDVPLQNRGIDDEGAETLAEMLRDDDRIAFRTLVLSGNRIGPEGADSLANAIGQNDAITGLDLGCNDIGPSGAQALANAIRKNTFVALASSMRHNAFVARPISRLILRFNYVGDEGAVALAESLRENGAIEHLDLSGNDITAEGAEALAGALRCNATLKELILEINDIGDEGAEALAGALSQNSTTCLDLTGNSISKTGVRAFAKALVQNPSRVQLCLKDIRKTAACLIGNAVPAQDELQLIQKVAGIRFALLSRRERKKLLAAASKAGLERITHESLLVPSPTIPQLLERVGSTIGIAGIYEVALKLPVLFQHAQKPSVSFIKA